MKATVSLSRKINYETIEDMKYNTAEMILVMVNVMKEKSIPGILPSFMEGNQAPRSTLGTGSYENMW